MPSAETYCLLHNTCESHQALLCPVVACHSDFGVSRQQRLSIIFFVLAGVVTAGAAWEIGLHRQDRRDKHMVWLALWISHPFRQVGSYATPCCYHRANTQSNTAAVSRKRRSLPMTEAGSGNTAAAESQVLRLPQKSRSSSPFTT